MLSSMTGFGRAVSDTPFGSLTVEIQSVNRKYLEIFVLLPKELGRFEMQVRKWLAEAISRGQISCRIFLTPNDKTIQNLLPDPLMLKEQKLGWEKIAREIGTDPKEITLPFLMLYGSSAPRHESIEEKHLSILRQALDEAVASLIQMRKVEGTALGVELESRLQTIGQMLSQIEESAPNAVQKLKQKLCEKMQEVGECTDERLLKEVALFAEKVDISEEIVRLRSHILQFRQFLKSVAAGKKMEFLIQEMLRETNTIGAKAMEAVIAHLVVDMKAELEKMREQVQNLE